MVPRVKATQSAGCLSEDEGSIPSTVVEITLIGEFSPVGNCKREDIEE